MARVLNEKLINDIFNNIYYKKKIIVNENNQIEDNNKSVVIEIINKEYFPNIPSEEKTFIYICYIYLLNYIFESMYKSKEEFWEQMRSNKNQDLKTIFLLLLPYLKNNNTKNVKSINEIFSKENNINLEKYKNYDIIKLAKELKYTNKLITLINNQKEGILKIDYRKIILVHLEMVISTIRKTNHKMMINWHNIWPMKHIEIDLFDTKFLIPSDMDFLNETVNNLNDTINLNENDTTYIDDLYELLYNPKGLWVGEVYQQIYNRFYLSILHCKFLIYPYFINGKIVYGGEILDDILKEIINIEKIDYSKSFYDYDEKTQFLMEEKFSKIKENISGVREEFLKMIVLYLLNNSNINKNISDIIINNKFLENIVDNDDFFIDNKNSDKILEEFLKNDENRVLLIKELLKNITIEEFYNFIYDSIEKMKTTPYYRFLYKKENKSVNLLNNFNDNILNIKWIYNWAKSCCFDSDFINLPKFLDIKPNLIGENFFKKLRQNNSSWFNISNNIKRTFGYDKISSSQIHQEMTKEININGINLPIYLVLIFDDMLRNGVLSEFKVNTKLTDKEQLSKTKERMIKQKESIMKKLFKENDWDNSYYYLTNEKYKDLEEYSLNPSEKEKSFFVHMETFTWSYTFANDWVCQIYFNTHFLNQQIIYVTGATGTGKSTHVPKLTMYATKAFLYKYNGHVMGTQPRVGPTVSNIWWISKELGVPISNYKKIKGYSEKQDIPTDNYNLQYKYQGDSHMKNNNCLKLSMVTDGTLLMNISNSITLKHKRKINKNKFMFTSRNMYDVIMIDEAHEHNHNMDIILSMMKQTLYYNPEIRLLIISATMDDDEPLYRSYYSLIDDNECFPYNNISLNPNYENIIFDKNFYDRRFHMAPPGATTQYKVEEVYKPINGLSSNLTENSKLAQEEAYKVVVDIANKNPSGDILLFSTGKAEIIQAVEELNKRLPDKTIALPFYTRMNSKYKSMIRSIEKYISTLKVRKDKVHQTWGEDYIEDETVSKGLYNRAVIIATNVAEASLTINGLKFVVDIGYSKEAGYNEIEGSTLKVEEISEASRIQRKGRVGRVSSGIAYFMYEKGGRERNRPKLSITQKDPVSWMSSFIKNKEIYLKKIQPIMTKKTDFHLKEHNYNNQSNKDDNYLNIIKLSGLYFLDKNKKLRDDNLFSPPKIYYNTIDEIKTKNMLLDFNGEYWIIHPRENDITRNVFYNIIKYKDKEINHIPKEEQKIINNYINNDKDIITKNGKKIDYLITSEMSQMLSLIESAFEINNKDIIQSILYGDSFGVIVPLLMTLSLGELYKWNVFKLLGKNDYKKISKMCKYNSDIEIFIELSKTILLTGGNIILNNLEKTKMKFLKNINSEIEILKKKYYDNPEKLYLEDRILLDKINTRGEMNNKKSIKSIVSKTKYFKNVFSNIKLGFSVPKLFDLKKIEGDLNDKFREYFISYLTLQYNLESDEKTKDSVEIINNIKKNLRTFKNLCANETEEILFCLVAGNPQNTIINLSPENKHSVLYESLDRNAMSYNKKYTLVGKTTMQHYMSSNTNDNGNFVNCLSNIPIEWLIVLDPIYYYEHFKMIDLRRKSLKMEINITPEILFLEKEVMNKYYLVKQYWNQKYLDDIYNNTIKRLES